MSLIYAITESMQFKRWLVGADSPLEFDRQTVRDNADILNRSQAAHMIDRLDVANNVVIGLKFWARKRKREIELFRAKKKRRENAHEEELHQLEPLSLSFGGLYAMYETHMAFHFFEKARQNLRRPRLQRDGLLHPLRFDVTIDHYDDALCYKYFGMTRAELRRLYEAWGVRSVFHTQSRYKWLGESAFIIYMRYMCDMVHLTDPAIIQEMGYRGLSYMVEIVNEFDAWLYTKFKWLYTDNMDRWAPQLKRWRNMVRAAVGKPYLYHKYGWVCMFVDGTFTRTCRPGGWAMLQQVLYTRYKKAHGVGCQGVMAPNGLFINWWGPAPGRHQDNWMVSKSDLTKHLRSLFDLYPGNVADRRMLRCYGDLIYAETLEISRGYRKDEAHTDAQRLAQKAANHLLNGPRTVVEHGFAKIEQRCPRILQKSSLKPMGGKRIQSLLANAMFISNCHTCLRGSQVNAYFASSPPTLEAYVNGGVEPRHTHL